MVFFFFFFFCGNNSKKTQEGSSVVVWSGQKESETLTGPFDKFSIGKKYKICFGIDRFSCYKLVQRIKN